VWVFETAKNQFEVNFVEVLEVVHNQLLGEFAIQMTNLRHDHYHLFDISATTNSFVVVHLS